jgi:hypothetical protein
MPMFARPVAGLPAGAAFDHVEVIGRALVLGIVIGLGMRKVANQVGVPMTTARGGGGASGCAPRL